MRRIALLSIIVAITVTGCDLLSTRTPQQPAQQSTFRTPTAPDIVLDNFQKAVNNRDASSYGRCFADSTRGANAYRFIPASDAQFFAARFLVWSAKDEAAYFINLNSQIPSDGTMSLLLDSLQIESGASDSTVYDASYTIVAKHSDPTKPTQASGRMHLTVKPDPLTQLWAVTQWIDVATTSDPSWSVLKARFSQ